MQYKRILAVDYGDVRIGLAQTDLMQMIASPVTTIQNKGMEESATEIADYASKNEVETIVLGLPLNMDGSEGVRAEVTHNFANILQNKVPTIKIAFQDERLSSSEAEDLLIQANVRREKRKQMIDKLSACIILESYMSSKK